MSNNHNSFPIVILKKLDGEDLMDTLMRYIKEGKKDEAILSLTAYIIKLLKLKNITANVDEFFLAGMEGAVKFINKVDVNTITKAHFCRRLTWSIKEELLTEMMIQDGKNHLSYGGESGSQYTAHIYRLHKEDTKYVNINEIYAENSYENGDYIPELSYTTMPFDDSLDVIKTKLGSQFYKDILFMSNRERNQKEGKNKSHLSQEELDKIKQIYLRWVGQRQKDEPDRLFVACNTIQHKGMYVSKSTDNAITRTRNKLLLMARRCLGQ